MVFTLSGDEYALPIDQVQEVVGHTPPRSIASRVARVRGVINLRGTILPACDLAARLERVKVTDDPAVTAIAKLGERLVVLLDARAALAGAGLERMGRSR